MAYTEQTVTNYYKWSDKIFSFSTSRPDRFQFENGEFVTLGLRQNGKLIARAYSIVSNNEAETLEFLSIHVPDGPLTSQLAKIKIGDKVWVNDKPTGTLTLKHVQPGRVLYMLSTGTGLAPFMSLVRSEETYQQFERVVLIHTVRRKQELAYSDELTKRSGDKFIYFPTVTREPYKYGMRCTELFQSLELSKLHDLPIPDPEKDRVMLCGNPNMNQEMSSYLEENGWNSTSHRGIGNFTVEKAFVLSRDKEDA